MVLLPALQSRIWWFSKGDLFLRLFFAACSLLLPSRTTTLFPSFGNLVRGGACHPLPPNIVCTVVYPYIASSKLGIKVSLIDCIGTVCSHN